jgi:hypothetical protein
MIGYAIAGAVGAIMMGRTKPKTRLRTYHCFGPRTGATYTVETLPGDVAAIVHAGDGTIALFERQENGTFRLHKGLQGRHSTVEAMQKDLEP